MCTIKDSCLPCNASHIDSSNYSHQAHTGMSCWQEVKTENGETEMVVSDHLYKQQKQICEALELAQDWTLLESDIKQLLGFRQVNLTLIQADKQSRECSHQILASRTDCGCGVPLIMHNIGSLLFFPDHFPDHDFSVQSSILGLAFA